MRLVPLSLTLALAACNGGETTDTDDVETKDPEFEDFIDVAVEAQGDFDCHEAGGAWLEQDVDEALAMDQSMEGIVEDFQTGVAVEDATVELWFDNQVAGNPDATGISDVDGNVTIDDVPACTPMSYRVSTDPDLDATRITIKAHHIFEPPQNGSMQGDFLSVSKETYQLIPSLLGVSVDPEMGVLAGTAFDCHEDPIEAAQVVVVDGEGNIPPSLVTHYFVDEFPSADQPHTSDDGLWTAINVPEGTWTVEMWALRDGELVLSGATDVQVWPNTINIANIFTGSADGVHHPASCEAPANAG